MLSLRAYRKNDAPTILSWCSNERSFYQWSAGILGTYPATVERFAFVETMMPYVAQDEEGPVGFFTLRHPDGRPHELRMGFVIVDPTKRGTGLGCAMVKQGLSVAFGQLGAEKVSLSVFENNEAAYRCYKAAGFKDVMLDQPETYELNGATWVCREMEITRPQYKR